MNVSTNQYGPWRFYHRCENGMVTGVVRDATSAGTNLAIDLSHSRPTISSLLRVLATDVVIHRKMMSPEGFVVGAPLSQWEFGLFLKVDRGGEFDIVVLAPENSPVWSRYPEVNEVDREEERR